MRSTITKSKHSFYQQRCKKQKNVNLKFWKFWAIVFSAFFFIVDNKDFFYLIYSTDMLSNWVRQLRAKYFKFFGTGPSSVASNLYLTFTDYGSFLVVWTTKKGRKTVNSKRTNVAEPYWCREIESFRFEDDEKIIFSILSTSRAWTKVILAGKRDSCRHSTTGFCENSGEYKLSNVRSFIIFLSVLTLVLVLKSIWNI